MKKNSFIILTALIIFFFIVRLPGLSLPYHQDEWKTARAVEIGAVAASSLYHPPLTQLSYRAAEMFFGGAHLRVLPLLFSFFSIFLLYAVVLRRAGERAALVSIFLYSVSFYSILASHMIDTDGALLPFFFLLSLFCYDRWGEAEQKTRRYWFLMFVGALFAGFMIKLSFVIVLGVFIVDYILTRYKRLQRGEIFLLFYTVVAFFGLSIFALFLTKFLYPAFQLGAMLDHALLYAHLSGRNYTQIIVQTIKALEYLSPLLVVPLIFITRDSIRRSSVFIIYLILGGIFYFILFDFSRGALDKYLMYTIVPLSALVGTILASHLSIASTQLKNALLSGGLLSVGLLALNFFYHTVLPLYPKQEWFARVFHGEWNMLIPFTGGSGPLGFYISFLFIGGAFFLSFIFAVFGRARLLPMSLVVIVLMMLGVSYNVVFAEEYQWGMINGSAPQVLQKALKYIEEDPTESAIITYNDIGTYELSHMKRYENRFYAVPEYESVHRERFAEFKGNFLVVEIPRIYEGSFYEEFFGTCDKVFETNSRKITATIYGC